MADTIHTQPEPAGLSDEELLELMPQQFRDDLVTVSRMAAHGAGPDVGAGLFRVSLNTGVLEFARAVEAASLARVQRQPVPPQPVPVSERLPGPEDMTDDGEVWIEDPGHEYPLADAGDYDWEPHKWVLRPIGKFDAQNGLRWLPAHALPLPGEVEHG